MNAFLKAKGNEETASVGAAVVVTVVEELLVSKYLAPLHRKQCSVMWELVESYEVIVPHAAYISTPPSQLTLRSVRDPHTHNPPFSTNTRIATTASGTA